MVGTMKSAECEGSRFVDSLLKRESWYRFSYSDLDSLIIKGADGLKYGSLKRSNK